MLTRSDRFGKGWVGAGKLFVVAFEFVVRSKDESFPFDKMDLASSVSEESRTDFRALGVEKDSWDGKVKNRTCG